MRKARKEKLVDRLLKLKLAPDRLRAEALVLAGKVRINGERANKPGTPVSDTASVTVDSSRAFVGRGGRKLWAALENFRVDVTQRVCADIGSSTGGFTDVLLQRGASKVYAIDVGYGELDWKLRSDARVVVMERTNARLLESLAEPVSFVCADLSFISLRAVLPNAFRWMALGAQAIVLLKPQFEAEREDVEAGGIVRLPETHRKVITRFFDWCDSSGIEIVSVMASPILGGEGNREFLIHLRSGEVPWGSKPELALQIEQSIGVAVAPD